MATPAVIGTVLPRALLLVVAAAGAGCSSSTTTPEVDPITPTVLNSNGCFDGRNAAGISGCWYAYGDWYGSAVGAPAGAGDCGTNMGDFTADQCSTFTTPVPGQPFTNAGGNMCTSGTAAKVIPMAGTTSPDYAAIWGAGIGFDLNNPGTHYDGTGRKLPWDATAHSVTGFSFTIDMVPIGGQLRIEFPTSAAMGTTDLNAAYWGGATAGFSPLTKGGTYSFKWADVGGPMNLSAPMPFDETKILSMQFHVVTNTSSVTPFSYCISNIRALMN